VPDVAVIGASGYTGALAAALVQRHPYFTLSSVTSRSDAGLRLDELYPHHRVPLTLEPLDETSVEADAAIVALPHGASAPVVAELHERGMKVVDLSADFRLRDVAVYESHYVPHPAPQLIPEAVYGLPERYRDEISSATLVASPGCFPTAAILALAPLGPYLRDVVIDAKTGISGAGRAPTARTHFVAADENVTPYGVGTHRHTPEIDQELAAAGADGLGVTFVAHLVPVDQGELLSCYVTLTERLNAMTLIEQAYGEEPFIELVSQPPGMRAVRDTNYCRIHVHQDGTSERLIVFAVIDNLWKGSSSQALQSLNLMFGYDETEGLRA
jgi:N-acetyl-gamma-glutamyl-phosphate reductase